MPSKHRALAYGLGVDSTAILVGWVQRGIRPDLIMFADVGAEKQATYDYLPLIQNYLQRHGMPPVTVIKYKPPRSPYDTIEGNMVMNATLPGATFGRASCTMKWKIQPQDRWVRDRDHLFPGKIVKTIGFDASEDYRKLRATDKAHAGATEKYEYVYPLIEWGWDRAECKRQIWRAGLPVPPKSSCIFCPNVKPEELTQDYTPEELGRVVRVEVMAEPYNRKVEGLWRRRRKRDNRPGSITEYLVENGIPFTHPDDLEHMPLNPKCQKWGQGFTFKGPHNEVQLSDLIGGCKCSKLENHFHEELVKSL